MPVLLAAERDFERDSSGKYLQPGKCSLLSPPVPPAILQFRNFDSAIGARTVLMEIRTHLMRAEIRLNSFGLKITKLFFPVPSGLKKLFSKQDHRRHRCTHHQHHRCTSLTRMPGLFLRYHRCQESKARSALAREVEDSGTNPESAAGGSDVNSLESVHSTGRSDIPHTTRGLPGRPSWRLARRFLQTGSA